MNVDENVFFARRPCGLAAVLICKISDKCLLFIKINVQNQNWSGAEFRAVSYSFAHALLLLALPLNPLPILINHTP